MSSGGGSWARRRGESGQTTALVASMLFTLTIFVALVVNVGQLVNRRVALQLVADAGAWSGATVQAVQMNHYAFWSRMVQNSYAFASGVSFGFNASECWSGVAAVGQFEYANSGMLRAQGNFLNTAYDEARRHSLFNIDDLFPGERNNFDFSTHGGTVRRHRGSTRQRQHRGHPADQGQQALHREARLEERDRHAMADRNWRAGRRGTCRGR